MTIAEAIRILEQSCPKRPQKLWSIKRKEAVKMAIEALEKQAMLEELMNMGSEVADRMFDEGNGYDE